MLARLEAKVTSLVGGEREDVDGRVRPVGPEIWEILQDLLGTNVAAGTAFTGGPTVAGIVDGLCSHPLSGTRAREIAEQLRRLAFEEEHQGVVAVRLQGGPDDDEAPLPGVMVTLATALEFLAALAGSSAEITFHRVSQHDL